MERHEIPLRQLRFGNKETWGLQVSRSAKKTTHWQFIPKGSPGTIHLWRNAWYKKHKTKRQEEILPYANGRLERLEEIRRRSVETVKLQNYRQVLTLKLDSQMILHLTLHHFGQVEADPSERVLTTFETYFEQRRPFFIEGKSIFQFEPKPSIVIHNMDPTTCSIRGASDVIRKTTHLPVNGECKNA